MSDPPGARARPTGWLVLIPLAATAVVYGPIVGNYFFADDFLNLYRIVNVPLVEYVLTPHAGHVLVVRNALFWLFRTAFGLHAEWFFAAVLLTHLLNVWLLFAAVRALSGGDALACFGATLWGVSPLHQGTLGWYSVYGQVVATTALLTVLTHAARLNAGGRVPGPMVRRWWYALALIAATSFGVGTGGALALPFVVLLLFPDWRDWTRRPPLLSLVVVVPIVYVAVHALFAAISAQPIPGLHELSAALTHGNGGATSPAAAYVRALPAAVAMLCELVAYGTAELLAGPYSVAGSGTAWLAVLVLVGALAWLGTRKDRALQRRVLAAGLLALACYASVAAGRAAVLAAMGVTHGGLADRYHYAASAPLVVCLCLILHALQRRLGLSGSAVGTLLAVWLGWMAWSYARAGLVIDHHDSTRRATDVVLAEITRLADTAPSDPAYLANRPFAPTASVLSPADFPGWGALFVAFSRRDGVGSHAVRFVTDPATALAARRGRRSAAVLIATDAVPEGAIVLQPHAVDAGLMATPFGLPQP